MQKKKTAKKKTSTKKKKAAKKRSQQVNNPPHPEMVALEETGERKSAATKKVICFNMECKLRRAGCYGYEACPGFKGKW